MGRGSIHHQPNIEESKLSLGNINDWAVREMISTGETSRNTAMGHFLRNSIHIFNLSNFNSTPTLKDKNQCVNVFAVGVLCPHLENSSEGERLKTKGLILWWQRILNILVSTFNSFYCRSLFLWYKCYLLAPYRSSSVYPGLLHTYPRPLFQIFHICSNAAFIHSLITFTLVQCLFVFFWSCYVSA